MAGNHKASKFRMDTGMNAFEAITGKQRSYRTDTEHERTSCANAGGDNWGTGFQNQMNDLLVDDVMQMAINDKFKEEAKMHKGAEDDGGQAGVDREKEEDHEDRHDGKNIADDDLEAIRARRLAKMQEAHKKKLEYKAQGHGEYTEIKEDEFLDTVTKSYRAVVHFYHKSFESCKVMDMHLDRMAKKFFGTKFVKLDSEMAPFFVGKLAIQTIPSVCLFIDGKMVFKQLGFHRLEGGETNEVKTGHLARVFRENALLEEDFDSEDDLR